MGILTLILANTVAMGVRERTTEFGVLRVLGFRPKSIQLMIVGEAMAIAVVAGLFGLAIAVPLVDLAVGRFLEENMGKFFPAFRVTWATSATAFGLTLSLGALSALIPAVRAGRLSVSDALKRVG
jgi:putative ABC transport system permease protein